MSLLIMTVATGVRLPMCLLPALAIKIPAYPWDQPPLPVPFILLMMITIISITIVILLVGAVLRMSLQAAACGTIAIPRSKWMVVAERILPGRVTLTPSSYGLWRSDAIASRFKSLPRVAMAAIAPRLPDITAINVQSCTQLTMPMRSIVFIRTAAVGQSCSLPAMPNIPTYRREPPPLNTCGPAAVAPRMRST